MLINFHFHIELVHIYLYKLKKTRLNWICQNIFNHLKHFITFEFKFEIEKEVSRFAVVPQEKLKFSSNYLLTVITCNLLYKSPTLLRRTHPEEEASSGEWLPGQQSVGV